MIDRQIEQFMSAVFSPPQKNGRNHPKFQFTQEATCPRVILVGSFLPHPRAGATTQITNSPPPHTTMYHYLAKGTGFPTDPIYPPGGPKIDPGPQRRPSKPVRIGGRRMVPCEICEGDHEPDDCPFCNYTGQQDVPYLDLSGAPTLYEIAPTHPPSPPYQTEQSDPTLERIVTGKQDIS